MNKHTTNCILTEYQHMNPCRNKIFPFIFGKNNHTTSLRKSKQQLFGEQSRAFTKNDYMSHTRDNNQNSGFFCSSSVSPRKFGISGKSSDIYKNYKKTNHYFQHVRQKQRNQFQFQENILQDDVSQKNKELDRVVKENQQLLKQFSILTAQVQEQQNKYYSISQRYMNFMASKNERNSEKLKSLMEILHENQINNRLAQKRQRLNLQNKLKSISFPKKETEHYRRNSMGYYRIYK